MRRPVSRAASSAGIASRRVRWRRLDCRTIPCTSSPVERCDSVRYEPSWPVIPVTRMRAMAPSLCESRAMSKGRSLRVFVDLAPLSPDGGNGGARLFVLDLLRELLDRPAPHEMHVLVKPQAEAAVASLAARGA